MGGEDRGRGWVRWMGEGMGEVSNMTCDVVLNVKSNLHIAYIRLYSAVLPSSAIFGLRLINLPRTLCSAFSHRPLDLGIHHPFAAGLIQIHATVRALLALTNTRIGRIAAFKNGEWNRAAG